MGWTTAVRESARRWGLSRVSGRGPVSMLEALEPRQVLSALPFAAGNTLVEVQTNYGNIWIEMFNTTTPLTVQNFLQYVNADRYDGTFIHRHARNFVLQGGGYKLDSNGTPQHIETFAAVQNEYQLSNLAKTVAMAKQGGDPNSATSEFFFNLADNSSNLNNQNGGFTVFGQVVNGWDVVLRITGLEIVNAGSPYDTLPVRENYTSGTITDEHLVKINDVRVISSPGWSQEAKSDAVVRGAGSASGQSLFITNNELSRPIIFHQASSTASWTVSDLSLQTGAPTITGKLTAWFDTNDSRFYAAAPSAAGLLLFTRSTTGFWTVRNLGTEIATSQIVNSDVSVFTSTDGLNHVAGTTGAGQLVIFSQTSTKDTDGDYSWTFANIATRDLIPNGKTMPTWVGDITTYVTSWNGMNVAGLDSDGKIQVVWWAPGLSAWTTDNLSDLTGAPAITGTLTSYLTSWGGINLAGTDAGGKLNVTWWVPGSNWVTNNLTDQFSGPTLVTTSVSSYVTPWGGLNITGLDANGKINVYWWAPGMTDWVVTNLSDITTGAVTPSGRMTGVASPSGTINLVGKAATGEVLRYYWNPGDGGTWTFLNMTTTASFY
ncbi:MAG: peptidylprolyl isomerase [Phycisphaerales bacterium]|nr:peptidylprolyl isomerase [Phycisphaerales bacterium]